MLFVAVSSLSDPTLLFGESVDLMEANDIFDRECAALNALTQADVPVGKGPYAVVRDEKPVEWFPSLSAASRYARERFAPETYAIGNPSAQPDYLPMFIVTHPFA
jgi:hypothetical protein